MSVNIFSSLSVDANKEALKRSAPLSKQFHPPQGELLARAIEGALMAELEHLGIDPFKAARGGRLQCIVGGERTEYRIDNRPLLVVELTKGGISYGYDLIRFREQDTM